MSANNTDEKFSVDQEVTVAVDTATSEERRLDSHFAETDLHLTRTLSARVVTMLSIAGCIGTGLFLGSGKAVVSGGAVGAFLGYAVMATIICFMMTSLGEMSTHNPHAGNFLGYTHDYVEPALGFATGVIYYLFAAILPPVELTAAGVLIQYWDTNTKHLAIYLFVMILAIATCNAFAVQFFGEVEFAFGCLKVTTIVGLIILGLVIDLGGAPNHDRLGFRYWKEVPFNPTFKSISNPHAASFLGFWAVLTQAAFSFGGIESIAVVAGEAVNPRQSLARSFKATYLRIALLYLVSIFVISLCVPRTDANLLSALAVASGTAAQSPFVIMINRAGIKVLPSIINAVVFTSALSSGNQMFYVGTRSLVAMARNGHAPKILMRVNRKGVPYYAFAVETAFCLLSFLSVSNGTAQAFNWLSNLSTLSNMLAWISICIAYIRFHKATQLQGFDRKQIGFRGYFQPYLAWIVLISVSIIAFFNGFATFLGGFSASDFIAAYITLPIFIFSYVGYKVVYKSKLVPLSDIRVEMSQL